MPQSGPLYDNATKAMYTAVVQTLCRWLDLGGYGDITAIRLSEAAPASAARQVDALVALGDHHVLHLEFQSSGEARFGFRMLDYRNRLYGRPELRGKRLIQRVIMLGDGTIDDGVSDDGLDYRYRVHYLRYEPVEPLLADPGLAPLASLADVPDDERPEVLARAAAVIAAVEDKELREVLAMAAADLALLRLSADIIVSTWEVHAMPIPSFTEAYAEVKYQEGRHEGRAKLVAAMLRHRFGTDSRIPALSRVLAGLDEETCLRHVETAASLEDLAASL